MTNILISTLFFNIVNIHIYLISNLDYYTVNLQPITIAIQAAASFPGASSPVQSYAGGIITLSDGCGQELDHSVLVVGYGTLFL